MSFGSPVTLSIPTTRIVERIGISSGCTWNVEAASVHLSLDDEIHAERSPYTRKDEASDQKLLHLKNVSGSSTYYTQS